MTSPRTVELLLDCIDQLSVDVMDTRMALVQPVPDLLAVHALLRSILGTASEADAVIARTLKLPEVQP